MVKTDFKRGEEVRQMTREEALKELRELEGHEILEGDYAVRVAAAFGAKIKPYRITDDGGLKDAHFFSGAKSEMGYSAWGLAGMICDVLQIDYPRYFGRGRQCRSCVELITNYTYVEKHPQ